MKMWNMTATTYMMRLETAPPRLVMGSVKKPAMYLLQPKNDAFIHILMVILFHLLFEKIQVKIKKYLVE